MAVELQTGALTGPAILIGSSIVLFLLAILTIVVMLRRQERSVRRERALRKAGSALVTATDREGIYEAAITAVTSLVGADASVRVVAKRGDDHPFVVVAASNGERSDEDGATLTDLLEPATHLAGGEGFPTRPELIVELAEALGLPGDGRTTLLPLVLKDDLRGLLAVSSPAQLPGTAREALETLASQIALALERAALTEDLHRGRSEARFASLVQNSSDVVTVLDADSTARWVSPTSERVFGYPPEELEGSKLTSIVHPEDKAQVLQFLMVGAPTDDPKPRMTESSSEPSTLFPPSSLLPGWCWSPPIPGCRCSWPLRRGGAPPGTGGPARWLPCSTPPRAGAHPGCSSPSQAPPPCTPLGSP